MNIQLTEPEANDLAQLLDIACKAGGLQAAVKATPIFAKLQEAAASEKEPCNSKSTSKTAKD